ncbi:MucR family transcriptional regulator [Caulobacter sp. NIBR2454]|uniref:MucR family transcriptional regulator n=1 Tax=Caulobacter sp. NIBR2454 TaxID=3015996 RepID=UPI0022B717B3|nr:MucR family transcriptional regulator [Caulobacter sp. NIBR2454]
MSGTTDQASVIELTSLIVEHYVSNNRTAASDLPDLIKSVHSALTSLGSAPVEPVETVEKATAAQIRRSINHEYLVSFEDGKQYRSMKRHLTTRGMTPDDYRAKWGLPNDYPMVAPSYAAARSEMAKRMGLGQGGRGKAAPKGRTKKA